MESAVRHRWTLESLRTLRDDILTLAEQRHAYNVRVFGSVARGESHAGSDVDFLIDLHPDATLWDLVGLWQDLTELLGCKVDVVTEKTLKQWIRPQALRDAVPL